MIANSTEQFHVKSGHQIDFSQKINGKKPNNRFDLTARNLAVFLQAPWRGQVNRSVSLKKWPIQTLTKEDILLLIS